MDGPNQDSPQQIHNLLLVDDEEHILESLAWTLSRSKEFKCHVDTATNGEAGLAQLKQKKYSVILSDYKMPVMDGVEFLKRARDLDPAVIRILITGYTDIKIAKEAINKARIDYYMEKTWDNQGLREIIAEALGDFEFRKKVPIQPQAEKAPPRAPAGQRMELVPGTSYIVKGPTPDNCFEFFATAVTHGQEGFCISTRMPDDIKAQYGLQTTPIFWLTKQPILSDKIIQAANLPHIVFAMKNFVRKSKQGVIMLEGLDYLITLHGFGKITKLLQDMWEYIMLSKSNLLIPLNPDIMDTKELATIERYLKPLGGP